MKRFLISALAALLMSFGLAGVTSSANAGTINLIDADFDQPGGQGAGDHSHATNNAPAGFSAFHKFGSYNDTFVDTYTFTIASLASLVFDVTTTNHVINLNFALYGDDLSSPVFTQSGFKSKFGEVHDQLISFTGFLLNALLTQTQLTLKITGTMCACARYDLGVSGTTAVTPVPPALLLFLTAIVGIGGLGVMRRKAGSPVALAA